VAVRVADADEQKPSGTELVRHRAECCLKLLQVEQMWNRVVAGDDDVECAGDGIEIAEIGAPKATS
jgi:hypothetical protein